MNHPAASFLLALESRPEELERLNDWFDQLGETAGDGGSVPFEFRLAVYEAVANVISYAFVGDGTHVVTVEVTLGQPLVVAVIEDDGGPFDPTAAPEHVPAESLADAAISGRGISLMRQLTERLSYERRDGRNRLTIACRANAVG